VIVIVAGVSGSGKTTVGAMLAGRLGWPFADADDFHPAANVEKMRAGIPLTDADREPWLRAIVAWMDEHIAREESAVVGCSALKRYYRDELLGGRPEARMVFLATDRDVIRVIPADTPAGTVDTIIALLFPGGPPGRDGDHEAEA
jgi:carbohydrate kinase (thermoresistant glucokinase family)